MAPRVDVGCISRVAQFCQLMQIFERFTNCDWLVRFSLAPWELLRWHKTYGFRFGLTSNSILNGRTAMAQRLKLDLDAFSFVLQHDERMP